MCKFQPKIPGSPLDTYLNGSDKKDMEGEMIPPEGLEYIRQMDESIRKYHAGRSLKQGTSKSSGRSHSFSNSKKAHWFYLDEIVEHEKGSYPALDVFAFVELLAETKEVLRSLRHPDEWVELYRRWSDRRMSKGRAGAVIFDGRLESILMVQSFRGSFSFPAGKLEDDETEVECAIREVQEELGMDLSQLLNERQHVKAILSDKERRIPMTLFVISTPEKVQVKPSTKKEIQKIAWIHVTKLPGWTTSTTSSKLRFFNVEPFIPELKSLGCQPSATTCLVGRWARRNAEATLDPATQTSTSLSREAGLSADWLDLERALSCFDAAWDGALKTRRSFEAEVNRVKYMVLATLLNTVGMIFLEQATCGRPQWWSTLASVPLGLNPLTNVLLKRIILQMTEIHAGRDRTRYMRKTTYAEFIVGIMVVIIAISVAACASSGVSILNPDFLRPVTVALTLAILVLVVLDGVFSWSAYTALRSVVRDVRMVMPAQEAGRLSTAMAVARANLCLVVLAVLGTSLFYGMFVVGGVAFLLFYQAGPVQQNEDYSDAPFALALVPLVIWCLDSIFNDVCAVYLGCGPTQAALELVTQASQVDAVGMPVADTVSAIAGCRHTTVPMEEEVSWGEHKDGDLGAMPSCKDDEKLSYRRLRLLGQGSFGKAFLARDLSNNELVVMKQVRVEKMDAKARDTAVREAVALRRVRHPNVVRFRQVFVRSGWLCLVMDFADGGDLCCAVKERAKSGELFEESAVLECFSQVADAVRYVHAKKMSCTEDIKSRNVFLCRTGQALLGDFGLVRLLESTLELAHTRVGTPYYLSPEIIRKQPYNYKTDVWSLGVLLYEMAHLRRPFVGTLETLPKIIISGEYEPLSSVFSAELHQLVARMLAVDPHQRLNLADALQEEVLAAPLRRSREALQLGFPPDETPEPPPIPVRKEIQELDSEWIGFNTMSLGRKKRIPTTGGRKCIGYVSVVGNRNWAPPPTTPGARW
eukprot:g10165.t1